MKLTLISDNENTKIIYETEVITLDQALQEFEHFLKGSGFYFDGTIELSEKDN